MLMAKIMKRIASVSFLSMTLFIVLYKLTASDMTLTLAITFGTIAYHFIMRLIIGGLFQLVMHNKVDYTKKWFHVSKPEMKLYQKLKVKKWKNKMPTYDAEVFDVKKHSWEEIVQAMCQAELVHEVIALCSFLPIIASVWFGALGVFVITSILSAFFDLMFVCMQRFNRSRVMKIVGKKGMEKCYE